MAGVVRKIIQTATAPKAIGPYSQAVAAGNTLYISGQIGMLPATGELVGDDVIAQAEQTFKNMGAILKEAGIDFNNVVKTTVLLADINDFSNVNNVYTKYFEKNYPARAAYQVAALPKGAKIEVEAIAILEKLIDNE